MRNFWQEFKTPIVTVVLIFLAFAIYTKILGPIPFYVNNVNTNKTELFSASGQGEAVSVPDQATVNFGVTKTAANVQDAQKEANTVVNKIFAEVKNLGIKEKDIKTTNYSVGPNYEIQPLLPTRGSGSGYSVTQNIEVKVKPVENANKVIDLATSNGANLVGGVNFTFSDGLQKKLEQEATVEAVKMAKEKAKLLADSSGVRLGRIINVVSNSNPPVFSAEAMQKTGDQIEPETNVTPGENSIKIDVTIYYETY